MTDKWTAVTAVMVCLSAFLSLQVSLWVALAGLILGIGLRHPVLITLGLLLVVSNRSSSSLAVLQAPLPDRVAGIAQLMSDPEQQLFGTQVLLSIDGRRYLASAPIENSSVVRSLMMGEHLMVTGRVSALRGAPEGWLRARHIAGRLQLSTVSATGSSAPWYSLANAVHRTVTAGASSFDEEQRTLYLGLVMGDDRGQSDLMRFRFQASGLSHLLAVSGQNVAFLLAVAAPLLRRMPQRVQLLSGVLILILFALVTRGEPSVLRAAVMAGIALSSIAAGRVTSGIRLLSMTVIVLVLIDPLLVHSIGFQLSISATAGLLLFARPLSERLVGPSWLRLPLAVTLVAQAATAPVLVALAGGIPAAATPANLLAVPAAGFVMMLGVTVGVLAGLLRNPIAGFVQAPSELLVRWIDLVATRSSQSQLPLLRPQQLVLIALATLLLLVLCSKVMVLRIPRFASYQRLRILGGCAALAFLGMACRPASPPIGRTEVTDEATLWVGNCGGQVLMLGSETNSNELLTSLWGYGVRRLDLVVVSASATASRSARVVTEQFAVRRVLSVTDRSPPGMSPLGSFSWTVGGLQVAADRSRATTTGGARTARVARMDSACRSDR
ncbi:MAG: ComEC/Rec2 family competence protein [Microthrixaceae bacterium]